MTTRLFSSRREYDPAANTPIRLDSNRNNMKIIFMIVIAFISAFAMYWFIWVPAYNEVKRAQGDFWHSPALFFALIWLLIAITAVAYICSQYVNAINNAHRITKEAYEIIDIGYEIESQSSPNEPQNPVSAP